MSSLLPFAFQIDVGLSATIIGWIFAVSFSWGVIQTKITALKIDLKRIEERILVLDTERVRSIEFAASKLGLLGIIDSRVAKLEEYIPQIATVLADLKNLSELLRELRGDIKRIESKISECKKE